MDEQHLSLARGVAPAIKRLKIRSMEDQSATSKEMRCPSYSVSMVWARQMTYTPVSCTDHIPVKDEMAAVSPLIFTVFSMS